MQLPRNDTPQDPSVDMKLPQDDKHPSLQTSYFKLPNFTMSQHSLLFQKAPHFATQDQHQKTHDLNSYLGKWVILYFYPKDMTPGCTIEACSFRDNLHRLTAKGAVVLGVSADSVKRHTKFAENEQLTFPLLSDENKKICEAYGVLGKKKFMGREYVGILRNTYLIDPKGYIVKVYENVKPTGHVEEILQALDELKDAEKGDSCSTV